MTPSEKPADEQVEAKTKDAAEKKKRAAAKSPAAGKKSAAAAEPAAEKKPVTATRKAAAAEPAAEKATAEKATGEKATAEKKPTEKQRAEKKPAEKKTAAARKAADAKASPAEREPEAKAKQAGASAGKDEAAGEQAAATEQPASRRSPRSGTPVPRRAVVRARARYVRTSARKARMVCGHLRGKSVAEARAILAFTPRDVARDWAKLLESAVANAENNHELIEEDLVVREAFADEGPTIKRFRPRAQGRATPIRKRTSHLTITLTPRG